MGTDRTVQDYYDLTQTVFSALAPFYDAVTAPVAGVRRQVAERAGIVRGARVLDVATGTGQQAFAFAKRGADVTAVDLTESMLKIARKRNKGGLVKFEREDATHLRFPERTFDTTSISFALHDMPAMIRTQVLHEMVRVTKDDGTFIIVDYALPRNLLGRAFIYRMISLYEGAYYREFIASDLEELLREAGIRVYEQHSILLGAGRIWLGTRSTRAVP